MKKLFPLKTESLCKKCRKVIPAKLVQNNGDVYMKKWCPNCGHSTHLHFKDAKLYKKLYAVSNYEDICFAPDCAGGWGNCKKHFKKALHILVNVTNQCNLKCPVCFANSEDKQYQQPKVSEIFKRLPAIKNGQKHFIPIGGEPTLREDIFEIIKGGIKKGYTVKLATNGLKLISREYVNRLKSAGLKWVFLHLDSLDDATNFSLRSKAIMFKTYAEILKNLKSAGMKCQFGITIIKGINSQQMGEIIKFALDKNIFWVSLYPCSNISRTEVPEKTTHIKDVLTELETTTKGKINTEDFLTSMKLWSILYRLTKKISFRQKIPLLPIIIIRLDDNDYLPINRLFNPYKVLTNPTLLKALIKLIWNLPKLLNYNKYNCSGDFIFLVIQKFQDIDHFDLREASQNLNVYMTENKFIPIDIYNHLYRFKSNW